MPTPYSEYLATPQDVRDHPANNLMDRLDPRYVQDPNKIEDRRSPEEARANRYVGPRLPSTPLEAEAGRDDIKLPRRDVLRDLLDSMK